MSLKQKLTSGWFEQLFLQQLDNVVPQQTDYFRRIFIDHFHMLLNNLTDESETFELFIADHTFVLSLNPLNGNLRINVEARTQKQ